MSFIHRMLPRQNSFSPSETEIQQRKIQKIEAPLPWAAEQIRIARRTQSAPNVLSSLTQPGKPAVQFHRIPPIDVIRMQYEHVRTEGIIGQDKLLYQLPNNKHTHALDELLAKTPDSLTSAEKRQINHHYQAIRRDLKGILAQRSMTSLPAIMEGLEQSPRTQPFTQCFYTQLSDIGFSQYGECIEPEKPLQGQYKPGHIHRLAPTYSNYLSEAPGLVDEHLGPQELEKGSTINLTVHGTFGTSVTVNGWASPQSPQSQLIAERFGGQTTAFRWSGKNHQEARAQAAEALAKLINDYQAKDIKVNIFAHSHGGNVVNEAIRLLDDDAKINFLANLGTPVREDHRLTRSQIVDKTNFYVNVTGGKDPVAKAGGTDWVLPGRGFFSKEKASYGLAKRRDNAADFIIKIKDAKHPDLYSLAVINQLRDPKPKAPE